MAVLGKSFLTKTQSRVGQGAQDPDVLLERAQAVEEANEVEVAMTPLEEQFKGALSTQIDAKQDQVERIEDRLESLMDRQVLLIKQTEGQRPGRLVLPGARAKWQERIDGQKAMLQRMQDRLERVREIRDGMSPSGPKIEQLALRKLRAQDPELVEGWAEMQQARRAHELHLRMQEQRKRAQVKSDEISLERRSRGLSLLRD